jgi:hypothetical protein
MMAKYRKKPVIIEAFQWFKHGDSEIVEIYDGDVGWIETLEGGHKVNPGDWIITGINGEHYSCKPDIFEKTYEKVEEAGQ